MPSVLQVMLSNMAASLGIIFNGYILFVLLWNRKIHTPNRLLLLHLALVDTIFSLLILSCNTTLGVTMGFISDTLTYQIIPQNFHIATFNNTSDLNFCQAQGFLWTLLPIVIVWSVCGLSFDRCAAIYKPLHYSRLVNIRRVCYFVTATWGLGLALATPPLFNVCPYAFWDARWACTANCLHNTRVDMWYPVLYIVFSAVLPAFVILFCTAHMLLISRCHRHSILTAIYEVTLNAQATVTHQRSPCYLSKFKGRNAFFTILQVVGSLVVFTIPYYIVFFWEATNGIESNPFLISLVTFFLTCTPPINACIYGIKSRVLRQTLKRLLHQHLHPKGTRRSIKRRLSEIFSDHAGRPPLNRRLSEPTNLGRDTQIQVTTRNESSASQTAQKESQRTPFFRSLSLPTSSYVPKAQAAVEHKANNGNGRQLLRGDSAPEDAIVPCEDIGAPSGADTWRRKREMYAKSSSFPIQREMSYRERRKQRLEAMLKARQNKFTSICVKVDEDQIAEGEAQIEDTTT